MSHWSEKYLGKPWTPETDCYHWFRCIQSEQFDRHMPVVPLDHASGTALVKSAAKVIAGEVPAVVGWQLTDSPVEGDAVLMAQRTRPHHIGTVLIADGALHVLHALEGVGVIISDPLTLRLNGWHIRGYWSYAG